MHVVLSPTSKIVLLDGVPARVWEGKTERGVPVHAFITRLAVDRNDDTTELERALVEQRAPSAVVEAIPARLLL